LYPNAQGVVADVRFAHATVYVDSRSLKCNRLEGIRKKNEIETRKRDETEKKKKDKYIQEIAKRRKEEKRKQEEKELERKKAGKVDPFVKTVFSKS